MIPLLAPSELEANPAFARLWEYVTREVLAQDASSREEERKRERRWRASRRSRRRRKRRGSRRGEVDGEEVVGSSRLHRLGDEEVSFVGGHGASRGEGRGAGHGYEDRDQELHRELTQEGDGDEDEEDKEEATDDDGEEKGDKKEKTPRSSPSLDQHLHRLRVARTKRRILRDVLEDIAYLDLSATSRSQSHAHAQDHDQDQDKAHSEASEFHHSHSTEIRSQSQHGTRSPASTSTTAPLARAGGARSGIADVTRHDPMNGRKTHGTTDNVQSAHLPPSLGELVRVIAAYLHVELDGVGALLAAANGGHALQKRVRKRDGVEQRNEKDEETEQEEEGLLDEDILRFKMNIAPIANAVSSRLVELESSLCTLSDIALEHSDGSEGEDEDEATVPGTMGHTPVAHSLHESVQAQLSRLSDLRDTRLPSSLTALSTTLQQLLTLQRQLLQVQIQHLETSKHGVLSRYTLSKIAFLDTVAQAMALKAQVLTLEARKELELSPQAERKRQVLREKMAAVGKEDAELDARIRLLEGVLAEYDEAGEPGAGIMSTLGRRYKEIEDETGVVKRDIEMLQRRAAKRGS